MKSLWALVCLAVCALLIVIFQAIQQERSIRRTRNLIMLNTEEVKSMEEKIVTAKVKLQKLSKELAPLDKQKKQLTKTIDEAVNKSENAEQNLDACQIKKSDIEQEKSGLSSAVDMLRTSQNVEMQKMQEEVQRLKQHILNRDSNICEHVDANNKVGRKLCEDIKAASSK